MAEKGHSKVTISQFLFLNCISNHGYVLAIDYQRLLAPSFNIRGRYDVASKGAREGGALKNFGHVHKLGMCLASLVPRPMRPGDETST